jgi:signal transduction histidine kinase
MQMQTQSSSGVFRASTADMPLIPIMRLVLALSALAIMLIDPSEPNRFVILTYSVLSFHALYSLALYSIPIKVVKRERVSVGASPTPPFTNHLGMLYVLALRGPFMQLHQCWLHWIDIMWYTILVALSSGTNSIFFFGFLFAILVASFRYGFASGFRAVLASVALFTAVGYVFAPHHADFEVNHFLLRSIYLFALGYMIAYWGGYDIQLKRRLGLLKDVSRLSNPRFGVDRTIAVIMEQLRSFYDIDMCLVVMANSSTGEQTLRHADRHDSSRAWRAEPLAQKLGQHLLALPADRVVVFRRRWLFPWSHRSTYTAYDSSTGERIPHPPSAQCAAAQQIAALLDVQMFISAPLRYSHELHGRLYLGGQKGSFDSSDIEFLLQLFEHIMPVIGTIRLVDQLASTAAREERRRVALDLHDSVIQPYIGLHLALNALYQKVLAGDAELLGDLQRLLTRSSDEIAELRGHVYELKVGAMREPGLQMAVRRFAHRFTEATGIEVEVDVSGDLPLNDRLAAEVLQMVEEGLSNIRRHTDAARAQVVCHYDDDRLIVRIEDAAPELASADWAAFAPRSIMERAQALGGHAVVEPRRNGGSIVLIRIPL